MKTHLGHLQVPENILKKKNRKLLSFIHFYFAVI